MPRHSHTLPKDIEWHTLRKDIEAPEKLRGLTFFEAFTDVHTPPECLPPIRVNRMLMPYAQSELFMREAFRMAISALGLGKTEPSDRQQ